MAKLVSYLSTGDTFYRRMVEFSIATLRQYNQSIPIRVYYIDGWSSGSVDSLYENAHKLNYAVISVPPTSAASASRYFFLNRSHLVHCQEERVLYLDGDTIFRLAGQVSARNL